MPIKPENKNKYPKNWKQISEDIRFNRAKNNCEVCGIKNYSVIRRFKDGTWRNASQIEWSQINDKVKNGYSFGQSIKYHGFTRIILTVAHLDHNPENCDYSNLKAMCQKCHNNYDKNHRKETIRNSKIIGQITINW